MLPYLWIAIGVVVVVTLMVWGDDGKLWKNWLGQLGVLALILAVGGAIVWVSTYGN